MDVDSRADALISDKDIANATKTVEMPGGQIQFIYTGPDGLTIPSNYVPASSKGESALRFFAAVREQLVAKARASANATRQALRSARERPIAPMLPQVGQRQTSVSVGTPTVLALDVGDPIAMARSMLEAAVQAYDKAVDDEAMCNQNVADAARNLERWKAIVATLTDDTGDDTTTADVASAHTASHHSTYPASGSGVIALPDDHGHGRNSPGVARKGRGPSSTRPTSRRRGA